MTSMPTQPETQADNRTKLRWNPKANVWEFWCESWGGWCILRQTPSNDSAPMTYEQGTVFVAERLNSRFIGAVRLVQYDKTKREKSAARSTQGGTE